MLSQARRRSVFRKIRRPDRRGGRLIRSRRFVRQAPRASDSRKPGSGVRDEGLTAGNLVP